MANAHATCRGSLAAHLNSAAGRVDMTAQAIAYFAEQGEQADQFLIDATRSQLHSGLAAIRSRLDAIEARS
jgi:hypothetical protein